MALFGSIDYMFKPQDRYTVEELYGVGA